MRAVRMTALGAAGAAALSGCTMTLIEDAPPPLPAAYTSQLAADDYEWIDRADSLWEAIGDAPPDYAFAFEGREPWMWETQDGYQIVVEDVEQGGIRSYYFAPGAEGPFLAVEPGVSFGYEGRRVSVVYGADGGAIPRAEGVRFLDEASRLHARGAALKRAMLGREWREVDSRAWVDSSYMITGFLQLWDEGRQRYPDWRRHRERHGQDQWRGRQLEAERDRRRGLADAFQRWQRGGFGGTPPGNYRRPGEGWMRGDAQVPGQPGGRPRPPGAGSASPPQSGAVPRRGPQRPGMPPRGAGRPRDGVPPVIALPVTAAPEPGEAAPPRRPRRPEMSPDTPQWPGPRVRRPGTLSADTPPPPGAGPIMRREPRRDGSTGPVMGERRMPRAETPRQDRPSPPPPRYDPPPPPPAPRSDPPPPRSQPSRPAKLNNGDNTDPL